MPSGFIEVVVQRRRRGRRSARRRFRFQLPGGIRCEVGDRVPPGLIQAVVAAIAQGRRSC